MGNDVSREVTQRGSDLIDIHQGLLYTVLEIIFTHSTSSTGLAYFIDSAADLTPTTRSTRQYRACHLLCLCALVSYTLPEDDVAAAFLDPQPSDWIAAYLEAAGKDKPLEPMDSHLSLTPGDRCLLRHMQQESRKRHDRFSKRNTLTSQAERRRREDTCFRHVSVGGAYHSMNGDAKLEAIQKALGLLASLVEQADLKNWFVDDIEDVW
ncbi:hypothetical protein MMC11_008273 [Xylographa trunciseda]|nr:hypothetical protein [Xylographa trunciseda]